MAMTIVRTSISGGQSENKIVQKVKRNEKDVEEKMNRAGKRSGVQKRRDLKYVMP